MSKADPKHGRWILPVVIAGLIGFTYLFVNSLPPGDGATTDTTVVAGTGTTEAPGTDGETPSDGGVTTTTAVDPETRAFLLTLDDFVSRTNALGERAQTINDDWDARTINYATTQEQMGGLIADTDLFVSEVAGFQPPNVATEAWVAIINITDDLGTSAADMLDGLVNASGPDARLNALAAYNSAADDLVAGLETARTAAGG